MSEHFFVVGAQRCGTTYLHRVLHEHPEIVMAEPVRPEPRFFYESALYAKGLDWYEATYFPNDDDRLRGEKSVGYLESDASAQRIADAYPGAPILVMLRDPIARAISHYWFTVENGLEDLPIEEALVREDEGRVATDAEWFIAKGQIIAANPYLYLRRGRYVEDLRRWVPLFGRERIHIMIFEDTVGNEAALSDLYRFLGVDSGFRPAELRSVVNAAPGDRSIPDDLEQHLTDYFEPHNQALAEEFSLDLSSWDRAGA